MMTNYSESLASADALIQFAILTDPHNEIDITEFTSLEDETRISIITEYMKEKGYRPITAKEYIEERAFLKKNPKTIGKNITLWRNILTNDSVIPILTSSGSDSKKHRHEQGNFVPPLNLSLSPRVK